MVATRKRILTSTQKEIIKAMLRARRPQTTYKLGKRSDKSWKTTRDNLEILKVKKVVQMKKKDRVSTWTLKNISKTKKSLLKVRKNKK